jgi:molecular chaperone GrpE (heat shock protein)
MSDDRVPARLAKWPFYLADLLLSAVIFFVLYRLGTFEGTTEMIIVTVCVAAAAVAAWISILPWLKEHDASVHLKDSGNLKSSLEQIHSVEKVAELIRQSNAQWQTVQDASARTVASAREITDRMKVEADEFMKFISQAHDQERAGLRLEVEKLRRMEGDWIKVAVQMLDHIFALTRAAERSGQAQLIRQLHQFQGACRDVARRMGLATFVPAAGEPFDQRAHQLTDPQATAQQGDKIQDVMACGFTYQGQLLRRSLVTLEGAKSEEPLAVPVEDQSVSELQEPSETEPQPRVEGEQDREGESVAEEPEVVAPSAVEEQSPGVVESMQTQPEAATQEREEPPAIIDTFSPDQVTEQPSSEDEEQNEAGIEEQPATRPNRGRKKTSQEELPF